MKKDIVYRRCNVDIYTVILMKTGRTHLQNHYEVLIEIPILLRMCGSHLFCL
jgi:hypothetical protein